jgi:multiple sugar transport system substrate-binding protein/sn-glycerol 3-phosphate transport system substrate-binding protein
MRKKFVFLFAVLLIASMVLGACATATETPVTEPTEAPTEEPVVEEPTEEPVVEEPTEEVVESAWAGIEPAKEIVFWHQHSGDRETELLKVVDAFNATNEYGIHLTAEYQGGYTDIFNKMLPILNTEDVPDVVVGYQNQTATYQLAGAMFDMNEIIDDPVYGMTAEEQADFFPSFFAQDVFSIYDGARLGLPPNRSMEVLYYNQSWLEELGYDGPPTTPAEFKEMACAAAATPYSGATAEGSLGYQLSIDTSRFASWTFAFGGDIFDYDANQFTLNSDASVAAMEFLQDLFDEGCARIVSENYGDQTDFGNGTLLFAIGSTSGLTYYKSAVDSGAGHEWSIAALPTSTGVIKQNVYGASVGIPKSTPERELAAWIWLKYYTSPEPQAAWAKSSLYFPTRTSVAEDMTAFFLANPAYKKGFDLLEYGAFEPAVPGYDFVRTEVNVTMAALVEDPTLDVPAELATLNGTANEILAEQLAQIEQ